jgi:hypothetical protein
MEMKTLHEGFGDGFFGAVKKLGPSVGNKITL